MAPLSYALLNEVLQYPVNTEERISVDNNHNIAQDTNIINPNKDIYKNICMSHNDIFSKFNSFREFFTPTGVSTDELMREQIFLTKLILFLLLFIFVLNLTKK